MSTLKVFKHYARYFKDYYLREKYDFNNVSEMVFVENDKVICFTDRETDRTIPMRKEDGFSSADLSKKTCNWPILYNMVDMDNENNYLYLYDGESDRLISKFLILYKYYSVERNKYYYITKMEGKFKETLAIFDCNLEGGKYLRRNRVIYYTTGNNKPGVIHKEEYHAYIKSQQDVINAKIKKEEETAIKNLTLLDSFLIETGGLFFR